MPAHAPIACCGLVPAGNWQPTGRRPTRTRGRLCPIASGVSCASCSRSCPSCLPDDPVNRRRVRTRLLSASLGEAGVLTAGGDLECGERDVAAGLEEPPAVVPVHIF